MDYKKLTIPQLKALCKEKKLTGYSKLNKPALIAKLEGSAAYDDGIMPKVGPASALAIAAGNSATASTLEDRPVASNPVEFPSEVPQPSTGSPANSRLGVSVNNPGSASATVRRSIPVSQGAIQDPVPSADVANKATVPASVLSNPNVLSDLPGSGSLVPKTAPRPPISTSPAKRKQGQESGSITAKKAKLMSAPPKAVLEPNKTAYSQLQVATLRPKEKTKAQLIPDQPQPTTVAERITPRSAAEGALDTPILHPGLAESSAKVRPRKAFAPLVPKVPVAGAASLARSPTMISTGTTVDLVENSFDFGVDNSSMELRPISFPPKISQRKRVPRLSMVFSLLFYEDIVILAKLSRLYRYSARVAASHILKRDFQGHRLDSMMQKHPSNLTDFWPYLRRRRCEMIARKSRFDATFLGAALKPFPSIIHSRLWSTDFPKEITIAARFLLTLFYYRVSIGLDIQFENICIMSSKSVVKDEIWKVTAANGSDIQHYYVVEATCEIVGLPCISTDKLREAADPTRRYSVVRADWSSYIEDRTRSEDQPSCKTLLDHLSWPNHEEYDRGISRNWLRRVEAEGEVGALKLTVAHRYVMACLVANSLSGRAMTSTEMEQEFNGKTTGGVLPNVRVKSKPRLSLFLPAHHFVESVHLRTRKRTPLHAAVACAQTPGREYYILRDNGLQIGCEEDGIAEVWQKILGCDSNGVPVADGHL